MKVEHENKDSPIGPLISALASDEGYRLAWQANIAIAFYDEFLRSQYADDIPTEDVHRIANNAAKYFLKNLCRKSGVEK